jgi:hypothetical protein
MWNLNQYTCTIPSFNFGASSATMFHAAQRTNAQCNNVMRLATFNVNDK